MKAPQEKKDQVVKDQRIFTVGLVGASEKEAGMINRIFTATNYRNRCYKTEVISQRDYLLNHKVDFILMCSANPGVITAWKESTYCKENIGRPMIFLARSENARLGEYQLSSPINPGKFVKLLDHFTIRELNFFPEFEIGGNENDINDSTIHGYKLLQSYASDQLDRSEPPKSVLVVDDSLAVRRQMELQFKLINAELDVSQDAESAMEAITKKQYDIIFLDVVMPGMDGYTACKKIKKDKRNANTPVILLTSKSSSFDKIKGALAGCDAYLVKPINHNEFEEVYNKYTQTYFNGEQAHAS